MIAHAQTSADLYEAADRHPRGSVERARLYRLAAAAHRREDAARDLAAAIERGRSRPAWAAECRA